jgi:hypothetical protein
MATPFALQLRQFTDEFKPDLFMALAARRKGLSADQRYLMGQAMLRVNHAINSAFRDDGWAFKKFSHKRVHFWPKNLSGDRNLLLIDAIPICQVGMTLPIETRWVQLWEFSSSHLLAKPDSGERCHPFCVPKGNSSGFGFGIEYAFGVSLGPLPPPQWNLELFEQIPFTWVENRIIWAGVSTSLKCAITLAVVFGILYVLISPLPELDAAFSGKSAVTYFMLVTQALLGLYFLTLLMRFRPIDWNATAHGDVLKMICVRLC